MIYLFQQFLNALQLGSIYALIALGYTMVYGILTMINFAHGDLFMVGAFSVLWRVAFLKLPFVPTLLLTMVGVALLGVLDRAARLQAAAPGAAGLRDHHRPRRRACSSKTSPSPSAPIRSTSPISFPTPPGRSAGISISSLQVMIIVLSLVLMMLLDFIVQRTMVGMAMRAISWDKTVVPLMGVPVDLIISITFAIGTGLGGAAGMMYALAYPVIDPYMGIMVGWKAFISAVVGGIGNIRGAMIGGYILGAVEILVVAFFPPPTGISSPLPCCSSCSIFRPYGILGKPQPQKV